MSKEEVYKKYIADYGVFEIIPIKNDAVKRFVSSFSFIIDYGRIGGIRPLDAGEAERYEVDCERGLRHGGHDRARPEAHGPAGRAGAGGRRRGI